MSCIHQWFSPSEMWSTLFNSHSFLSCQTWRLFGLPANCFHPFNFQNQITLKILKCFLQLESGFIKMSIQFPGDFNLFVLPKSKNIHKCSLFVTRFHCIHSKKKNCKQYRFWTAANRWVNRCSCQYLRSSFFFIFLTSFYFFFFNNRL